MAAALEWRAAIVIDAGSYSTKCGFAGGARPSHEFPTLLAREEGAVGEARARPLAGAAPALLPCAASQEALVLARSGRKHAELLRPIDRAEVSSADDLSKMWEHAFKLLEAHPRDNHCVVLTDYPLAPPELRARAAELLFETHEARGLYMVTNAVAALYASGRTTGVVLDAGHSVTHLVPVHDGFIHQPRVVKLPLAGRDLTAQLATELKERAGLEGVSADALRALANTVKEEHCYVAESFEAEAAAADERVPPAAAAAAPAGAADAPAGVAVAPSSTYRPERFTLPDGKRIVLGAERFRVPEMLFAPRRAGLDADGLTRAGYERLVAGLDMDLRRDLFRNMVKVVAAPERRHAAWLGGSIVGLLNSFDKLIIRREEFQEHGANAILRKLF